MLFLFEILKSQKLEFRYISYVFLGYSSLDNGFKCVDLVSGNVYIFRHVLFNELHFPYSKFSFKINSATTSSNFFSSFSSSPYSTFLPPLTFNITNSLITSLGTQDVDLEPLSWSTQSQS